jgi:VCBS repeat-containing protein
VNDAPVAAANSYSMPQGGTLSTPAPGLLGNDTDIEGDALAAILVSDVAHGALSLNTDGSFTYTPAAAYSGTDSFTYKVNDGTVDSNIVTVSLTISASNAAPVASGNSYTVTSGTTLNIASPGVLANDSDPDGNTITAVLASSASHGTVSLNANGSFNYTPTAGYTGSDSFDYKVSDGSLTSAAATVSITITAPTTPNRPPVLIVSTPIATTVSTPITFTIKATDPDNDPITITFGSPVHGTITGAGPDYIYTPAAGFAGTDSFTVTAKDDRGGTVTKTIKVNVTAATSTVGNYALHLRGEDGEVAAHVVLTTTKLGRATGVLTIGGVRYTIRGFFGGPPSMILPKSNGFQPAEVALATDNSNPTAPGILITATNEHGTFTGRSARSPYSATNPAPQAGDYTLIASRQSLVLDRVGLELAEETSSVPQVASALTARVRRNGAVIFNGSSGHGYPLTCSSYVMQDGIVPFYAGRNNPGASIQHSTLTFRDDSAGAPTEGSAPAITGTLRWIAGLDRRVPQPFDAEYAVLGAHFTAVPNGAALLNSPTLTLSLNIPSFAAEDLATPFEETRGFDGNLMPRTTGNIATTRVNFNTGTFITRVQRRVTRPIFGVIIQGEGIDRGLGSVVDFTSLGTCELRPAPAQPAGNQ